MPHQNPFQGMPLPKIYEGLRSGRFGPKWPSEELQKSYTGTAAVDLTRRAFTFAEMLDKDQAFKKNWKGLDYGCGWGRFLSVLLAYGTPDQLDGCDAWQNTLNMIGNLNYKNKIYKVPEILGRGDIEPIYDFALSFSVFTHLSPRAFLNNLTELSHVAKTVYITVRHEDFIDLRYKGRRDEIQEKLASDNIAFIDSGGDMTGEKLFGDTVITKDYLDQFGKVRYLGMPHTFQHVYAISSL